MKKHNFNYGVFGTMNCREAKIKLLGSVEPNQVLEAQKHWNWFGDWHHEVAALRLTDDDNVWLPEMILDVLGVYNQPTSTVVHGTIEGGKRFVGFYNAKTKRGALFLSALSVDLVLSALEVGSIVP